MRQTVRHLITEGLGYCCPWMFFRLYRRSSVIADRLGVTVRAVQKAKAAADAGKCEGCEKCLRTKITVSGDLRKIPVRVAER